jgi:hypothetical protein
MREATRQSEDAGDADPANADDGIEAVTVDTDDDDDDPDADADADDADDDDNEADAVDL